MKRSWKQRKGKEKGQSLTEVALVLPVLLFILAGVLDLGRIYYVQVALSDAAGEGAVYAAIRPNDATGIKARAQAASGGLVQIDLADVVINPSDPSSLAAGDPVTVIVEYDFTLATPLINAIVPAGVIRLRGVATEPILAGDM